MVERDGLEPAFCTLLFLSGAGVKRKRSGALLNLPLRRCHHLGVGEQPLVTESSPW